jgi:hypothetical protein
VRSANCTATVCALNVGNRIWTAPGIEGPWTPAPTQLSDDPEGFVRAIGEAMAANLSDPECPGTQTLGDRPVQVFRYRTRTNPNEFGSWWGGLYTAFIDVETGQMIRLEERESVASWAADPAPGVKITTVVYDDAIAIAAPEG